jgi:hypothetical protein
MKVMEMYNRQHEQSKYMLGRMAESPLAKIGEHWLKEEGKVIKETVNALDSKALGSVALASAVALSVFAPGAACVLISVMYTPENLGLLRSLLTAVLLFLAAAMIASVASEILIIPAWFAFAKLIQDFRKDYALAAEGKLDASKVI